MIFQNITHWYPLFLIFVSLWLAKMTCLVNLMINLDHGVFIKVLNLQLFLCISQLKCSFDLEDIVVTYIDDEEDEVKLKSLFQKVFTIFSIFLLSNIVTKESWESWDRVKIFLFAFMGALYRENVQKWNFVKETLDGNLFSFISKAVLKLVLFALEFILFCCWC